VAGVEENGALRRSNTYLPYQFVVNHPAVMLGISPALFKIFFRMAVDGFMSDVAMTRMLKYSITCTASRKHIVIIDVHEVINFVYLYGL